MTITAELIYLFIAVSSIGGGIYWRWGGAIREVRDDLSAHKLHVAENYITKAGMREVKDEIMDAIHGVKSSVDHLGGRIDSMYSAPARPVRKVS